MSFSSRIKLTAQFAYEACAEGHPEVAGWDKEPEHVKEGWYKAAALWHKAEEKTHIRLPRASSYSSTSDPTLDDPKNKKYKGKPRAK